jgi:predicted SprT family Zn-dependent metalloprotease
MQACKTLNSPAESLKPSTMPFVMQLIIAAHLNGCLILGIIWTMQNVNIPCGLNMTNQELQGIGDSVWAKFRRIYPKLNFFTAPSIEFNKRLSSTAGRCFYEQNKIDISWKLYQIDSKEILEQTVPHEYAHQVSWNMYKAPGHCATWKSIMVAYGLEPVRCHSIGVEKVADNAFELLAKRDVYAVGMQVSFEHRDRARKITVYKGFITKINLKTIKVDVNGAVWTVPIESNSLKRI